MYRYLTLILITLIIIVFIQCSKKTDYVAKVENEEITVDELRKVLEDQFKTTDLSSISIENKEKTLYELIDDKLKILKAKQLGFEEDPEFLLVKEKKENDLLFQKLIDTEIIDKLIPNSLLKKYFDWQKLDVEVTSILIGYKGTVGFKGKRSREEAEKIAVEVLDSLKNTDDSGEIAAKYSDDPRANRNKGKMDSYLIGQFGPYADEAVFTANKNDVVGPFPVPQGFAIFQILSRRDRAGKSDFEKTKDQLKQKLFQSYYSKEANEKHQELTNEYLKKYNAEISDEHIDQFLTILEEWNKIPQKKDDDFTEEQRSVPIAKINENTITTGDLIDQFQGRFYKFYTRYKTKPQLKTLLQQLLTYKAWIIEAKKREMQDNPEVKKELNQFCNTQLTKLLDMREIRDKVEVTDEDVINQYEKNKSKYFHPEKIQLWEIRVTDENLANNIAKRARSGETFTNLAKKYTENKKVQKTGGYLGYQSRQTAYPETVKRAMDAGANKIVGPFKNGIYYYVIKTGEYVPIKQKELKEVMEIIRSGIQRNQENDKRKELMEQIRKEFSFQINDSRLRSLS